MRIKTFTLMMLALFVSTLSFAQRTGIKPDEKALSVKVLNQESQTPFSKSLPGALTMNAKGAKVATPNRSLRRSAEVVTPPDDLDVVYFTLSAYSTVAKNYVERTVKVIEDGDDIYVSGLSYYLPDAFVKGTFTDETHVTFEKGQYMGQISGIDLYFGAYPSSGDGENDPMEDAVATFDAETNSYVFTTTKQLPIMGDNGYPDEVGYYNAWYMVTLTEIQGEVDLPVEPPTGMETEEYAFVGTVGFSSGGDVSRIVNVGFSGNEVYIQGVSEDLPEAWIKGTMEGNIVTFKTGQLLGAYSSTTNLYFHGFNNGDDVEDAVFEYDAETATFTAATDVMISYVKDSWYDEEAKSNALFEYVVGVTIKKIVEKEGIPANPIIKNVAYTYYGDIAEFSVATVDTEGNGLVVSKLAYQLYYEDNQGNQSAITFKAGEEYSKLAEDMTIIPYEFTDNYDFGPGYVYLNMEHGDWKKIGIKSIYTGGGVTHESEIVWYTFIWPSQTLLPEGAEVTTHDFAGTTYGSSTPFESTVQLAKVGTDLYIGGLYKDEWVKGALTEDNTWTFDLGQFMGINSTGSRSLQMFLIGVDEKYNVINPVIKLDDTNGVYEFQTDFVVNASYTDKISYIKWYKAGSVIDVNATTGIESVKTEKFDVNAPAYNMAGQRVNKGFKGLVIKDGKKFVNK